MPRASKLLKELPGVLKQLSKPYRMPLKQPDSPQRSFCDIDLYAVLPRAKSEPAYVKSDGERDLEGALKKPAVVPRGSTVSAALVTLLDAVMAVQVNARRVAEREEKRPVPLVREMT